MDLADELLDRANFYAYVLKRFDKAIELYKKYAELRPDDRALYIYLFHAYWFNKDYQNAWKTFEQRFAFYNSAKDVSEMAKFELKHCVLPRRWDGKSDLAGKRILVWGEEGIGDILQFLRYLPRLKDLGGQVILTTRYASLQKLLEIQSFVFDLFLNENDLPVPKYDVCAPIMSIPYLIGSTDFPPPPYLTVEGVMPIPGAKKKVGLCWAGDSTFFKDAARSHRLNEFLPLASKDIKLVSLQKKRRLDEGCEMELLELPMESLLDTARIINGLDAVVSVDTCVIHLAGAMNKKSYLLKANYPEWRWGLDDTHSPWYPNTRLCKTVGEIVNLVNYEN